MDGCNEHAGSLSWLADRVYTHRTHRTHFVSLNPNTRLAVKTPAAQPATTAGTRGTAPGASGGRKGGGGSKAKAVPPQRQQPPPQQPQPQPQPQQQQQQQQQQQYGYEGAAMMLVSGSSASSECSPATTNSAGCGSGSSGDYSRSPGEQEQETATVVGGACFPFDSAGSGSLSGFGPAGDEEVGDWVIGWVGVCTYLSARLVLILCFHESHSGVLSVYGCATVDFRKISLLMTSPSHPTPAADGGRVAPLLFLLLGRLQQRRRRPPPPPAPAGVGPRAAAPAAAGPRQGAVRASIECRVGGRSILLLCGGGAS